MICQKMICHNFKKFITVSVSIVSIIILLIVCAVPVGAAQSNTSSENGTLYGDADKDGFVSIRDCSYIQRCITKDEAPEDYSYYVLAADLDQDSFVNIRDVTILQMFLAGIYSSLPINTTTPPSTTAPSATTTQPVNDEDGYNNYVFKP